MAVRREPRTGLLRDEVVALADERTRAILERRLGLRGRRGWLIRRALVVADALGLASAFLLAHVLTRSGDADSTRELVYFLITLPGWVLVARLQGLYDRDEERTNHTTADEFFAVLQLVTMGTWLYFVSAKIIGFAEPSIPKLIIFWGLATVFVTVTRAAARSVCRRRLLYLQNALIVGAGEVGQLIARKLLHHPEYGVNVVGFIDDEPKERRADLEHLVLLGGLDQLRSMVELFDIDRVIVAYSNDSHEDLLEVVRSLRDRNVQIDLVPRLFDLVGPRVAVHAIEGLALVGLPPARMSRSSRWFKRVVDVAGASAALLVTAPLFALIALLIKRDSPGPVFFRQTRLGMNMAEFTALKFRTMKVDTSDEDHRDFIRATMSAAALPSSNGVFKLEREDAITRFGRWLRRTSLDELPQLLNVLRGDMSLVGPRPCIPYETEGFLPHHFERFTVPAGITGLWQVTARAHSTFGEALDFDVAYARGWSLTLDLLLLFKTPLQLLRSGVTR
jgi:exopolysaccharide biosynthesis polyprenyl glycosylphosphotransferase